MLEWQKKTNFDQIDNAPEEKRKTNKQINE
jgi:translation elongation factor EF-Tu-like GTPase